MSNIYEKFVGLYPVSKTLRFELKPVGKTLDNIKIANLLEIDAKRAEAYKRIKQYGDIYHKVFIDRVLGKVKLLGVEQYANLYIKQNKTDSEKKELIEIQDNLRKQIANAFKTEDELKNILTNKSLIEECLYNYYKDNSEALDDILLFKGFTTYFSGYCQNRANMYVADDKSTAISYRLINENLPTFVNNNYVYKKISGELKDKINKLTNELKEYVQYETLDEVFSIDSYNDVLTQRGIENYNLFISGKTKEDGTKIQGLNEYINLYNQKSNTRLPKMKLLYKQILSDRSTASFQLRLIEDDVELLESIKDYFSTLIESYTEFNREEIFKKIKDFDISRIYLSSVSLNGISQQLFGDWGFINKSLDLYYDKIYLKDGQSKTTSYLNKKEKFLKEKYWSLEMLNNAISNYNKENKDKLLEYVISINVTSSIEDIASKYDSLINTNFILKAGHKDLVKDDDKIESFKTFLDTIKVLQEQLSVFACKDNSVEKSSEFYNSFDTFYNVLHNSISLYNKTRNYLTQKPFSTDKIKLNFNCPTFLSGWDANKEKDNLGIILIKDGKYYLAILNKNYKNVFDNVDTSTGDYYEKIEYKLLPGPNKMLPKVFFAKSNIDYFAPSEELIEKYEKGYHKKGEKFDIAFCHALIDFFKQSINKHEDWKNFNFSFSDTSTYKDLSEFYREVESQGYKISTSRIDAKYIDSLINDNKLFLFQIYNKDFSKHSHDSARENLHTMYWKALFDIDNLRNSIIKLNGEAEVFYRKASLKLEETAIHKANYPVKNKNKYTIENGKPTSEFTFDLIKNKRYTEDKFLLHVPITINFNNSNINNINELVNRELKRADDVNIIGIDRGERNLLYITVINQKGEILEQRSLNEVKNEHNITDYHYLLNQKEEERDQARKSWKTINNIKDLKDGYMSQIVHEIACLMKKYNAIIVIEDLNSGFKRSRIRIEKQVYQKFERKLIEKLNYLVFKDIKGQHEGGIIKGYQLTNKFDSFNKLGKQSGFLFYIPAWNTSKIDPTTGFINQINVKYESLENSRNFVSKINSISFNKDENYFEFDIDYTIFSDKYLESKSKWIICSNSDRIYTFRNIEKNNQMDYKKIQLTEEFIKLFNKYNIGLNNIKDEILEKGTVDFYKGDGTSLGFITLFRLMLQMRNSISNTQEDYLISPVKNKDNYFFDSRKADLKVPQNADANGAYNIARKGLMLLEQIKNTDDDNLNKPKYSITNKEWLNFVQGE